MPKLISIIAAFLAVFSSAAYADEVMRSTVTAYCQAGITRSGVHTRSGIVAADPRVLPLGSIVRIVDGPMPGLYSVMDTGAAVKGRHVDVFVASCARAKLIGRRIVHVVVKRRGY